MGTSTDPFALCVSSIRSCEPDSKESGKRGCWDQEHAGVSHSGLLCLPQPPLYLLRSCKTRLPLGRVSWRRQQLRLDSAVLRASQAPSTAQPVLSLPIQRGPCSFLAPALSHRAHVKAPVCLPGKPHTPRPNRALGLVLRCHFGYSKEGNIS